MGKIIEFGTGKERNRFVQLGEFLWEDEFFADLDIYERNAYSHLLHLMRIAVHNGQKDENGHYYCQIEEEELARRLPCKIRKIQYVLKKLESKGLLIRHRKSMRDSYRLYVKEYVPDDENLTCTTCTSTPAQDAGVDVHEMQVNTKYNNYNKYNFYKIQNESKKVKPKFGDYNQRQYDSNFFADLEKRMCGSG